MIFAIIHICGPRIYEWDGMEFEFGGYIGPWRIKKDGDPYKRQGDRFYERIDGFLKLPEAEREKFRTGGGCQFLKVPSDIAPSASFSASSEVSR